MKLFIFDVGNVVYSNTSVAPKIAKYLGITLEEFLKLAKSSGLDLLQKGLISVEDFWSNFSKLFGKSISEDLWAKFFDPLPIDGTIELIKKLRKHFRVVAGTNTILSHYEIHLKKGHYDIFDAVYASHVIHYTKPDPNFFMYILKSENAAPEETFFTDDDPKNVQCALALKINAFVFTDPKELESKLKQLLGH
ncbi:HAD-IA family hydrolase [Pseudothermotoga thermarum]|uniref:HAD-superfamily hydrolase, subfamily IA, variant 3 n=1 Tax=Pseudothermotoga thermarum DSM 5069 TaxID=688269 RepID=F7YTP3_9THEM|nr:HAD-IA family hydrolase [Pseudothermotoga thermarum]AEH51265.1 HAD-superfamily hydrolase, subfamily IA, variant 3 [Pseudothermotoga thermarum DSM 5069]